MISKRSRTADICFMLLVMLGSLIHPCHGARSCARGQHRISGQVTIAGDGACETPAMSFRVADDDGLGKLCAPLQDEEFFMLPDSPWQNSPRHISRQDRSHFHFFNLSLDSFRHRFWSVQVRQEGMQDSNVPFVNHKEIKMVNGDLETSYLYGIEGEEIYKEQALNNFEDGYTILLHDADVLFSQVQKFVESLEEDFGLSIVANLHYSPEKSICGQTDRRGDEDVFILQIEGNQIWLLADTNASTSSTTGSEDFSKFLLRHGDTLYIPAGWTHKCTSNVSFLFGESIQLRLYIKKNYYTLHRFFHTMVEKVLEPSSSLFSSDTKESLEFWRCSAAPLHFKDVVHWLVHAASLHRRWSNKNFLLARYGVIPVSGKSLDDESAEFFRYLRGADVVQKIQDVLLAHNGSLEGGNVFLSKEWRKIEERCPEGWKEILNSPNLQEEIEFLFSVYADSISEQIKMKQLDAVDEITRLSWNDVSSRRRQRDERRASERHGV
uniref:Bifunctional lysine-specific demethylase and histidyl-hydroxylase n=1 Tax=Guillardia theta TaxID=55529 RepID=A0A7S4JDB1_GUITH|mmetsp:Transcript_15404/g.51705  ORF Transcript_15404/g.51705 Transcript_15404/m.51705 type:complete len:494 (+) Transcript_15404:301-1782(+)